jgi:hypothetical protein
LDRVENIKTYKKVENQTESTKITMPILQQSKKQQHTAVKIVISRVDHNSDRGETPFLTRINTGKNETWQGLDNL